MINYKIIPPAYVHLLLVKELFSSIIESTYSIPIPPPILCEPLIVLLLMVFPEIFAVFPMDSYNTPKPRFYYCLMNKFIAIFL